MKKVLLFAKSPLPGVVKTRLAEETGLTGKEIVTLYTAFLKDAIRSAVLSGARKVVIAYYPVSSGDVMEETVKKAGCAGALKSGGISLIPQKGEDFDARVTHALNSEKGERDSVVIIGSDSPTLNPGIIDQAFTFLSRGEGVVLGPSGEGGVYLIGVRTKEAFVFDGLFSDGLEIENLVRCAEKKRLPLFVLEELTDVDIQSDLLTLIGNLSALQYSSRYNKEIIMPAHTVEVIRELGFLATREGGETRKKRLIKGRRL